MKTVRFYVLENDGDVYVAPESRLKDYVLVDGLLSPALIEGQMVTGEPMTRKSWDEEYGGLGKWLCLQLKPSTAMMERNINARCRIDHMMVGFQVDEERKPAARFEELVESWGHEDLDTGDVIPRKEPICEGTFLDLHPNLAVVIDETLRRHLRPNMAEDPDFLARLHARSKP